MEVPQGMDTTHLYWVKQQIQVAKENSKATLDKLLKEKNVIRDQNVVLAQRNAELQKQLEKMQQANTALTHENTQLRGELECSETLTNSALLSDINILKAANILQTETVNMVTDQLEEQTSQMSQLQSTVEHLQQELEQQEILIEQQQKMLEQSRKPALTRSLPKMPEERRFRNKLRHLR